MDYLEQKEFDDELRRVVRTAEWKCHGREWSRFVDMNRRLISPPETNFQFWDYIEKDEIETIMNRCVQLEDFPFKEKFKQRFMDNWKNLQIALDYCYKLRGDWQPMPMEPTYEKRTFPMGVDPFYDIRQNEERPIKQAIREGKVIWAHGSFIGSEHLPELLEAGKQVMDDLQKCIDLKDDSKPPVKMKVSEFLAERKKNTLYALHLKDMGDSDRVELEMD